MDKKEVDQLCADLMNTGDYEMLSDGSVRLKGLKDFPENSSGSGIRCPNMACQHDLYADGISLCSECLKLETRINRTCHLCGFIMKVL